MTDKPQEASITQEEVARATDQFKQWITTLPEEQQRVFGWILTRAATSDNSNATQFGLETAGNVDISTLMAQAAGLQEGATAEVAGYRMIATDIDPITIWTFKFG